MFFGVTWSTWRNKSFLSSSPKECQFRLSPLGGCAFVEAQESSREGPAWHWSKTSLRLDTEESERNRLTPPHHRSPKVAQLKCQEKPYWLMISSAGENESMEESSSSPGCVGCHQRWQFFLTPPRRVKCAVWLGDRKQLGGQWPTFSKGSKEVRTQPPASWILSGSPPRCFCAHVTCWSLRLTHKHPQYLWAFTSWLAPCVSKSLCRQLVSMFRKLA